MPSRRKSTPLPPGLKAAQTAGRHARRAYIEGVKNGSIAEPAQGTAEAKSLARAASLARWGRGPKVMRKHSLTTGITEKNSGTDYDKDENGFVHIDMSEHW